MDQHRLLRAELDTLHGRLYVTLEGTFLLNLNFETLVVSFTQLGSPSLSNLCHVLHYRVSVTSSNIYYRLPHRRYTSRRDRFSSWINHLQRSRRRRSRASCIKFQVYFLSLGGSRILGVECWGEPTWRGILGYPFSKRLLS
jgi:hypothetical protein